MRINRKRLSVFLAVLVAGLAFTGCSSSPKGMQDGNYRAEYKEADSHGWTEYVELTVADGKITEVDFDALGAEGERKSESQDYEDAMKNAGSAVGPMEFYPELEQQLLDKQKPSELDGVAGATTSTASLKKLVKELEKGMSKGDTATVKVDQESNG